MISKSDFEILKNKISTVGKLKVKIISDSMSPFIKIGDQIEILPLVRHPQFGEVIVFYDQNRLNCHFFLKYELQLGAPHYLTIGLKSKYPDLPVSPELVLGIASKLKKPLWLWPMLLYKIISF